MPRRRILAEIRDLDPRRDSARIVYLSSVYEFPWDYQRALELALLRTFAVPTISAILDASGEFRTRAAKRYDDTELILAEIVEHGPHSPRGVAALERLNAIHGRFAIANDDYLYVLSTFIYEPIRWIARFGWRPLSEAERLGNFWFWHDLGGRMGIRDIPADFAELERFNRDYERDQFRFRETNRRVGAATRELFLSWFPRLLRPVAGRVIDAVVDEPLGRALGFPRPLPGLPALIRAALVARSRFVAWLPDRREPLLRTTLPRASYPDGYRIGELGPPPADPPLDPPGAASLATAAEERIQP